MKKRKIIKICKTCLKEFKVVESRKDKAKFCSYDCYWLNMKGKRFSPCTEFKKGQVSGVNNPFFGKKHSLKTRLLISQEIKGKPKSNKGEKNGMWNGGSQFEKYAKEYTYKLKKEIKIRDNYT